MALERHAGRHAAVVSAGGVVVRGGEVAVIVPRRRDARGEPVLALPKGHPDDGETPEQAAAREVREETGLEAQLGAKLGEIQYWYRREGRLVPKVVAFYLFEHTGGDVADHDGEVEEVRWMSLEGARDALTYKGEREMVDRAISAIGRDQDLSQ